MFTNDMITDIYNRWNARKVDFPILFSMFQDYMAIPGTSVAIERKFIGGRDLISLRRSKLKADTVRMMTLAKEWLNFLNTFDLNKNKNT